MLQPHRQWREDGWRRSVDCRKYEERSSRCRGKNKAAWVYKHDLDLVGVEFRSCGVVRELT